MKIFYISILVLLATNFSTFGQQKNIFKLNVGDCVNCSSALSLILQKDPKITDVSLVGTQTTKAAGKSGVDIIKFTININKNGGAPDAK